MDQLRHQTIRFDRFTLDLKRGLVRVGKGEVVLPPKPFEVLRYLAENAGRLVTKDELYKAVWSNVVVSDDSLVQCIRELRSTLEDVDHTLIKTFPRRGYMLDAASTDVDPGEYTNRIELTSPEHQRSAVPDATLSSGARLTKPVVTALAVLGVLLLAFGTIWVLRPWQSSPAMQVQGTRQPILVVLPFQNLSGNPDEEYFVDGVTEDLTTSLSRLSRGMVIARSTAFVYKGKSVDVREVGRELGVRYVLEGTVARSENRTRVTARLTETATAASVWAHSFDIDRYDFGTLRDEIAARLARTLSIELANVESLRSLQQPPGNAQAIDMMMRARALFYRTRGDGASAEALQLFRETLRLDDGIADAWAGLARTYVAGARFSSTRERDLEEAEKAVDRALALEPNNVVGRLARGWLLYEQGRMDHALLDFQYAAQLDPGDPMIRGSVAASYVMLGQPEKAVSPLQDAMRLSPLDPELSLWQLFLGVAYLHLERDEEALYWLSKSAALNSRNLFTQLFLASSLALSGREVEARAAISEFLSARPGFSISRFKALEPSNTPEFRSQRQRVYEGLRRAGLPD